jgi:RimJ/RimL family protein N-acetyltransferase
MHCRDARFEDAAAIASAHVAAWRAAYDGLMPPRYLAALDANRARERWEQWLQAGCSVVVLEANGEVVGFCRYGPSRDSDSSQSIGEVIAINLHPASWRQGLGRKLLLAAISRLRAAGFTEATLWVLYGNERARRFYEALGWQPTVPSGFRLNSRGHRCTRCDIGFRAPSNKPLERAGMNTPWPSERVSAGCSAPGRYADFA